MAIKVIGWIPTSSKYLGRNSKIGWQTRLGRHYQGTTWGMQIIYLRDIQNQANHKYYSDLLIGPFDIEKSSELIAW